jgi:hypothetical protein
MARIRRQLGPVEKALKAQKGKEAAIKSLMAGYGLKEESARRVWDKFIDRVIVERKEQEERGQSAVGASG